MTENDIHILVVEDEKLIRDIFQQALENWGFSVAVAEDGTSALQRIKHQPYHIVITDLYMPGMDGMTLLHKIKDNWPFIEVIVVTGNATIESAIEAMKHGAFDFILKPVNFEQVRLTVKRCFQKIKTESENAELREINVRLQELNELKDKFLSITNHEIRTPITIIKGYLEILSTLVPLTDPEVKDIFDILRNTANEMVESLDRIHLLSRLQQGEPLDVPQIQDVREVVQKIYNGMYRLFQYRQIDLGINLPSQPALTLGNPQALKIIVRELVHNALKFTPDGGKVKIKVHTTQNYVTIVIQDTGVGIPVEKQEAIFKEFYEVQDVMNHRSSQQEFMGGGMGIGLSLVKELLRTLKGRIAVESEPGKGSSFIVYLPRVEEEQLRQSHAPKNDQTLIFSG